MGTGLALRRVARCVAVLSMFAPLGSVALAADAQSYQLAAVRAVANLDFARAIEMYSKGLEQPFGLQERADLLRMRGVAAHLAKKLDQAEADFSAVVKLVGATDPRAYSERGFFYHYEGRPEQALADSLPAPHCFPITGSFRTGRDWRWVISAGMTKPSSNSTRRSGLILRPPNSCWEGPRPIIVRTGRNGRWKIMSRCRDWGIWREPIPLAIASAWASPTSS